MLTAKEMGQEVAEEVRGFLTAHGISEIDFLKRARLDHHLMANLRRGEAGINTSTIEKIYRAIIGIDPDWVFLHELRDAVVMRAKACRHSRDISALDGLQQAAFRYDHWPRRGA